MLRFSEILENQLDLNHVVYLFGSLTKKGVTSHLFAFSTNIP